MFYTKDNRCYFKPVRVEGDFVFDAEGSEYQVYCGSEYYIEFGGQTYIVE